MDPYLKRRNQSPQLIVHRTERVIASGQQEQIICPSCHKAPTRLEQQSLVLNDTASL